MDWGFPRWRGYGSAREAAKVRLCDRHGCDAPGDCPAPKAPNSPESRYPKEITVTAGAAITLDREVHLQLKSRSGCHDRKDGTLYDKADYNQCPKEF